MKKETFSIWCKKPDGTEYMVIDDCEGQSPWVLIKDLRKQDKIDRTDDGGKYVLKRTCTTVTTVAVKETIPSTILLWNKDVGFIRLCEGTGDNLFKEDIQNGYVDYIMCSFLNFDGTDFIETEEIQIMLKDMYQDFVNLEHVIEHVRETEFIPSVGYTILWTE